MGVLSVATSALIAGFLTAAILNPSGPAAALMAAVTDIFNPYAQFEPDEFVFDYTLSAEVPRVYYLTIPRLGLHAPVVSVHSQQIGIGAAPVSQLHVPNAFAVGWSSHSAAVGQRGNTVFVGHNNEYGEVFKGLWDLQVGDSLIVTTASGDRNYTIAQNIMFQELGLTIDERIGNASWLSPTQDERLTMITCWPYYSNTHRVVVVAFPD